MIVDLSLANTELTVGIACLHTNATVSQGIPILTVRQVGVMFRDRVLGAACIHQFCSV